MPTKSALIGVFDDDVFFDAAEADTARADARSAAESASKISFLNDIINIFLLFCVTP